MKDKRLNKIMIKYIKDKILNTVSVIIGVCLGAFIMTYFTSPNKKEIEEIKDLTCVVFEKEGKPEKIICKKKNQQNND
jgi:hypothetical protein